MVKLVLSHSKLRKQPFFAENVKIHGGQGSPFPLSDAHAWAQLLEGQSEDLKSAFALYSINSLISVNW